MDKRILVVIIGLLVGQLVGCSTIAPFVNQGERTKVVVKATRTPRVIVATKIPTVSIPTVMPTPTHLPGWCYADPTWYLEEFGRISNETGNTIQYWNTSARGQDELLYTEASIRSLIAQAESLEPPEDFVAAHEHFLKAMQGTLFAIFGITDFSDENRIGNDATRQEEFEIAVRTIEDALAQREKICWGE